jgi:hypothetical protein
LYVCPVCFTLSLIPLNYIVDPNIIAVSSPTLRLTTRPLCVLYSLDTDFILVLNDIGTKTAFSLATHLF